MTRVLTTGGTIAMVGDRATPAADHATAWAELLGSEAPSSIEQVCNKPSAHLSWSDAVALADRVNAVAAAGEAVVVTHGTDLMEEVAFLCDLVYAGSTPVVFTGAMRPASALSADGLGNLRDAIAVANAPHAHDLGVVVAFAGELHAASEVRKVDSVALAPFASPHAGPLGQVLGDRLVLDRRPRRHAALALPSVEPRVEIFHVGLGSDVETLRALGAVADGLVLVAPGAGHVSPAILDALCELTATRPVAICPRPRRGAILHGTYGFVGAEADLRASGAVCAGALDAAKARVLLAVCLANELSADQLLDVFDRYDR